MMQYKSIPFEVKDMSEKDDKGYVRGKASYFGNVDSDDDIIDKGAYVKTLSENKSRIKYCEQHNMLKPFGKFNELYETDSALEFLAEIPLKSSSCRDMYEKIKGGVIDENSVGIMVTKSMPDAVNKNIRRIKETKLFEISAVTLAANDLARITEVKGWDDKQAYEFVLKKYDDLIKFIKKGDITDETGYAIEGEIMALKSIFENLTKPSTQDTLPSELNEAELINHLIKNLN